MRPIAVTMMGFGTFADPVTIDFEGADLFALVGPTGSGKSTVIDAICFALYGTIPRYDDRRAVSAAVHALAAEARVSLTFELGGRRYMAARVVRRDKHGKASTKDARLELVDGEVLAGSAREMETAVPTLLGLGFDQFTRAVVLPQGEFARFLHDKPATRQDLLVQLLGLDVYERMMQQARVRAAETNASLARDRERIEQLAAATPELCAELRLHADACATARSEWRTRKPELDALAADATRADAAAVAALDRVRALNSITVPADVAVLAAALEDAERELAQAEAAADVGAEAVAAADGAVAAVGERDALIAARDAHALVASLDNDVESVAAALATAVARADATAASAQSTAAHAEALRAAGAAHVVRDHLVVGEPCPVCEQVVSSVPTSSTPEAWSEARDCAAGARGEAESAAKALARAEHRAEDLAARLAVARSAVAGAPDLESVARGMARIEDLASAAVRAREQEHVARRAVRVAREVRDEEGRRARSARDTYRAARDELRGFGLVPPPESDDIAADWSGLTAWSASEAVEQTTEGERTTGHAAAIRSRLGERLEELVAAAAALGLEVASSVVAVDGLIEAAAVEERLGRDRAERLDADLSERSALVESVEARAGHAEVASELARLLDANHFERWLVSEALTRLVDGGSARFHDLSGGRYSFVFESDGRDLLIVDHLQGDERRSVRTLSGGETFQASLALALALSDQLADLAADGAARLESIFLDEGFGTLDAETLELVATTLENLGAEDRMVGIVTHVPELAARMPVQFRVSPGPRSRVERMPT